MIKIISADLKKIRAVNTIPLTIDQEAMLLCNSSLPEEVFNKIVDHSTNEEVYYVKITFTTDDFNERGMINVYGDLFQQDMDSDCFYFTSYNKMESRVEEVINDLRNKPIIPIDVFVDYIGILIDTLD